MRYFYLAATNSDNELIQVTEPLETYEEAFKLAIQLRYFVRSLGLKQVRKIDMFEANFFDASDFKAAKKRGQKLQVVEN